MAFFDDLTISLKQKWLQFFQVNRSWIARQMEVESVYTPDGGRRPPSYFILGVVNAIEPQLAEMMLPFSKLNPDIDAVIDLLELNFDPDLVLGNRFNPQAILEELDSDETVTDVLIAVESNELSDMSLDAPDLLIVVESNELSDMSLDEMADEVVLVETDDASFVVLSADEAAALTDISFDEMADEVVLNAPVPDALGNMSLDEIADAMGLEQSDLESLETPSATQADESNDLSSDVWDEGPSSESEQAQDETRLGDEK